jgi:hypothetical protein
MAKQTNPILGIKAECSQHEEQNWYPWIEVGYNRLNAFNGIRLTAVVAPPRPVEYPTELLTHKTVGIASKIMLITKYLITFPARL